MSCPVEYSTCSVDLGTYSIDHGNHSMVDAIDHGLWISIDRWTYPRDCGCDLELGFTCRRVPVTSDVLK